MPENFDAPAPFGVVKADHRPHLYRVVDADGMTVCLVPGGHDLDSGVRAVRLAWLMAAAPDLQSALDDLKACAETLDEFNDPGHDFYVALKLAEDALASAKGRGAVTKEAEDA